MLCLSGGRHSRTGLGARLAATRIPVIIGANAESRRPAPAPSSRGRLDCGARFRGHPNRVLVP
ncbi:hypothetical protein SRABI26_00579 [Arthrobacter sp. Bi26]|nr:hypothetical protein SRABI26_00579 [Arthrobacter sp. Bi26]